MRINADGQVTIPADLREKAGLLPDTEVVFETDGNSVRVISAAERRKNVERALAQMRGTGDVKLSTDEIMALMREP